MFFARVFCRRPLRFFIRVTLCLLVFFGVVKRFERATTFRLTARVPFRPRTIFAEERVRVVGLRERVDTFRELFRAEREFCVVLLLDRVNRDEVRADFRAEVAMQILSI